MHGILGYFLKKINRKIKTCNWMALIRPYTLSLFIPVLLAGFILAGCAGVTPESAAPKVASPTPVAMSTPTAPAATKPAATTHASSPSPLPVPITAQPAAPTKETLRNSQIAYTGVDGNIWLFDPARGESMQITEDAVPFQPTGEGGGGYTNYCCAEWSSDGMMLAFRKEVGTEAEQGIQSSYELRVYDVSSGDVRTFLKEQQVMNFAWRPGSHLVAYDLEIPVDYFINPSPELAQGIWTLDVDSGESQELVLPERGNSLLFPKWSGDGRFLSFEEVVTMEGSGKFAYYDLQLGKYFAWDAVIGNYSWSPDGERIAYDRLSYAASGNERIWIRDRQGGQEKELDLDFERQHVQLDFDYAYSPIFSPTGSRLVYLLAKTGSDEQRQEIIIRDHALEDVKNIFDLGEFYQVGDLTWSADGHRLFFTAGPSDARKVIEINISNQEKTTLVNGSQPAVQP